MSKDQRLLEIAQSQLGSPYVFGAWGEFCTPTARGRRKRSDHPTIVSKCQVLGGKKSDCDGCKYKGDRMFDCRGFTHWCLEQVGISIAGQGATSQWNTKKNWMATGTTDNMPDLACCLFQRTSSGVMQHTGLYLRDGLVIHCSHDVESGTLTKAWTHWAIPVGLYTDEEIQNGRWMTIMAALKKGSKGSSVKTLQENLTKLGYDVGTIDSVFGDKTKAAVEAFQQKYGLTVDGIAGTMTQEKIKEVLDAPVEIVVPPVAQTPSETDADYSTEFFIQKESGGRISFGATVDRDIAKQLYSLLKEALEL